MINFERQFKVLFILNVLLLCSCKPILSYREQAEAKTPAKTSSSPQSIDELESPKINGLKLIKEGPNCWNGALIKSGLIHSVRFVPKAEYWFWMNSQYCKKLDNNEKPQRGDLGSLFWEGKGHYHSFIYQNHDWVFSKNSPDPKYDYKIQKFEEMFFSDYQQKAKKCWNDLMKNGTSDCKYTVQFHRCRPIEAQFYTSDKQLSQWDRKISKFENIIFSWVSGKQSIGLFEYEKTIFELSKTLTSVQKRLNTPNLDSNLKFKISAMEFRIMGLIMSDIKITKLSARLHPIIIDIYKQQKEKQNN